MKIHEYQAKQLLAEAGVAVPKGIVAITPDAAADAFVQLAGPLAVVKSQIHAGGRGKGTFKEHPEQRGVVLVKSAAEARENAQRILGKTLVTKQTGPDGKQVNTVFVEQGLDIARELYLGIVVDREAGGPVLIMSSEGGMEIEEVAAKSPEKILREPVDVDHGLFGYQARKLAFALGMDGNQVRSAETFLRQVCRFFLDNDCSMVEVNPLVLTKQGQMIALDAKVSFDDNAAFRHQALGSLRDLTEEDPAEIQAGKAGLSFVKLDGNIGCLVNGAGLAMATMDIIKLHGGEPANFLDVGGGANAEQVTEAFRILLSDKNVKAVLVNIFGGIMKCDTIVEALLTAYEKVGFNVPLVVRLEGTNVETAREMLTKSGRPIISANGLTDAAQKVVAAIKGK
jgi:succinyl-CoA synthetase beta subunit